MKKKLLLSTFFCGAMLMVANLSFSQTTATAASAVWQPEGSSNIPGNVVTNGNIQANEQGGTLEAYAYSTSAGPVSDATGFQRTRSSSTAPALPAGGNYDPNFYLEYKVQPATGKYLRVTKVSLTALGGGTGNARLIVKYSTNGTTFSDMPVSGSYFDASASAVSTAATEADPVVLINTSSTASTESNRTLSFNNMFINLNPGQVLTVRLYPFLADSPTSSRYFMSRNMVISGVSKDTTLPLDFVLFTAKPDAFGKTVDLNWKTTNEVNTKNFEIQKRTDATDFVTIGSVKSNNVSGFQNYSFKDLNASAGTSYYRILQFDNDGSSSPSEIISVNNSAVASLKVYPNPVAETLNISHVAAANGASFRILSLDGKTLLQGAANANTTSTSIDVSQLSTGAYMLIFDNNASSSSLKFVKK